MVPTWTYVKDDDGIYVNLFIGSTIKVDDVAGTDVEMVQKTDYPWSGKVAITVNPAEEKEFAVRVRAPQPQRERALHQHAGGRRHRVDLRQRHADHAGNRERLRGRSTARGKPATRSSSMLPMKPQRVKCIDEVDANRGRVALRYGPLVYNIESVDGNNMDGVLEPDCRTDDGMAARLAGRRDGHQGQVRRRLAAHRDPELCTQQSTGGKSGSASR